MPEAYRSDEQPTHVLFRLFHRGRHGQFRCSEEACDAWIRQRFGGNTPIIAEDYDLDDGTLISRLSKLMFGARAEYPGAKFLIEVVTDNTVTLHALLTIYLVRTGACWLLAAVAGDMPTSPAADNEDPYMLPFIRYERVTEFIAKTVAL